MLAAVTKKFLPVLLFIVMFALSRTAGALWSDFGNFSAAYALLFCGGVYLSRTMAWWLPLSAMLITDIGLNLFYQFARGIDVWAWPNLRYQLFVYIGWVLIILLGKCFKPKHSFASLLGGGLLGAIIFYFVTNTAAWLFNPFQNPEYSKTFLGWLWALIKGTGGWPETWQFFRNTLLSSGLFTAIFVGAMKLSAAESAEEKREPAKQEEGEPDGEEEPAEAKA